MSRLNIDDIVNVVVSVSGAATPRDGYNVGLIVGKSTRITTSDRCKVYGSLDAMLDDGFVATDPEYKAATLYFSADPAPGKLIVGVCGADESWAEAVTACRSANGVWYGVYCASADAITAAEHQAVAAYVETIKATYFYDDATDAATTTATTDAFYVLKGLSLKNPFGLFSKTPYAAAAAMGFAMGANDGTAGSAYTMAYKALVGVTPDDLNETQIANLKSKNANYYVVRGGTYNVLEPGVTANGSWYDEVIGLDQLANDIQIACMDVLTKTKTKNPYTDNGVDAFVLACNEACNAARVRGFLAPGIWTGDSVLNLAKGDTLESGYMCQADSIANQPAANKSLRVCPPIYVSVNLAGAIHSVTIKVLVV